MKPFYQQDGITIYHGDCLEVLPTLRAGLIVTDPPFYVPARLSASRKTWPRSLSELAVMDSYFRSAFRACVASLDRTGALYSFCDCTSHMVFLAAIFGLFDRTACLVWDKRTGGMGNGWRRSHELILHGAFDETDYAPGFRRDVIQVDRVGNEREHPSEKPIDVLAQILKAHPDSQTVDPFMGCGSTLVAAKDLGRKAIGIEIEERYCEIAAKRLAQGVLALKEAI